LQRHERASSVERIKRSLDGLYERLNRREFVHPDPLEFLYRYDEPPDREVAGLVASSLAYGRVAQILRSVGRALERLGPSPARFLERATADGLRRAFAGFKHRFTTGEELARLLFGARRAIEHSGSLGSCFSGMVEPGDETVVPALGRFVRELSSGGRLAGCHLLPSPEGASACKRLCLYLRWMVRKDDVDPGGWEGVEPSTLVVPLDTHMHRLCRALGFTDRRQADLKAALEVTSSFRKIAPEDPARYDFCLTRLGIRADTDERAFLSACGATEAA
jgi:uncharacterized protein (TIGR02757 family)